LLRYEKEWIRISIWGLKETYFKKQLGFENVSFGLKFRQSFEISCLRPKYEDELFF
jgi:hypothetical protein